MDRQPRKNHRMRMLLGLAIGRARRQAGLSQQMAADGSSLAQSTISRLETGTVNGLRYQTLMRILEALDVVEIQIRVAPHGWFADLASRYDRDGHGSQGPP
jgi:transcriptional regulator with XRE-family HTH domain